MNTGILTRFISNWLWIRLEAPEYHRFLRTLNSVEDTQRGYLMSLLRRNAGTEYGRRHHFADISSLDEYRQALPLTNYEDYYPYLEEIAQGKPGVLTDEPVFLFEPSSGTSSASKLIPYTGSLKEEFRSGIAPWVVSLFTRKPELKRGSAYWSVSPPMTRERRYGNIRVGFDEDAEYLGKTGKWLHRQVTAVPPEITRLTDEDTFKRQTMVYLLADSSLALISVWSPTFLTILLKQLMDNQEKILRLLEKSGIVGCRKRAETIRAILRQTRQDEVFEQIWPELSVISCWTHGPSEVYAEGIKQYFPNVEIQGKGLVATEAFVSLPLLPDCEPVLAVNSHFFEFLDSESGEILLAHEVEEGKVYSVIVTTGGGLYRYRLGDLVRVTGFISRAPTLRFITKEDAVSDLFGEKLHSDHLLCSVSETFSAISVKPSFFLLAPVRDTNEKAAYSLFLHSAGITARQAECLRDDMEKRLCENFHYQHCRKLGQLEALKLFIIDCSTSAEEIYAREMQRRGLKLGNIKPAILDRETGWEKLFPGRFLDDDGN